MDKQRWEERKSRLIGACNERMRTAMRTKLKIRPLTSGSGYAILCQVRQRGDARMLSKYRLTTMLLQALLQFIPILLRAFFHNRCMLLLYIATTRLVRNFTIPSTVSLTDAFLPTLTILYSRLVNLYTCVYRRALEIGWYAVAVAFGVTDRIEHVSTSATAIVDARPDRHHQSFLTLASFTSLPRTSTSF